MSIEFAPMPPVLPAPIGSRPQASAQVHFPMVGRRRPYRSAGDAMAYEAGWLEFSDGDKPPPHKTPFADGWHDAAADHDRHAMHALHRGED